MKIPHGGRKARGSLDSKILTEEMESSNVRPDIKGSDVVIDNDDAHVQDEVFNDDNNNETQNPRRSSRVRK